VVYPSIAKHLPLSIFFESFLLTPKEEEEEEFKKSVNCRAMNHEGIHEETPVVGSVPSNDATIPQPPRRNNQPHNHNDNHSSITLTRSRVYRFLKTCGVIFFWYCISTGTILTTKWLFKTRFPYPLLVTTYSNAIAALWAFVITFVGKRYNNNNHNTWVSFDFFPSSKLLWEFVAPIGVCTALEIGCSNLALKILTVSFGTILKGVAPVFTFVWGLFFGIEHFSWMVASALAMIATGIALASLGEGQAFELLGFVLQLVSSALSGLRWAMTHKLLKQGGDDDDDNNNNNVDSESNGARPAALTNFNDERIHNNNNNDNIDAYHNDGFQDEDNNEEGVNDTSIKPLPPLAAVLYTSPMTCVAVLPFAIALEGERILRGSSHPGHDNNSSNMTNNNSTMVPVWDDVHEKEDSDPTTVIVLGTMTVIATLVFVLLMSEYWLVKVTSSLTLSVAGVFKELLTIGGGLFLFSESVDTLNVVGFVISQIGILSYVWLRTQPGSGGAMEYTPVAADAAVEQLLDDAFEESNFRDEMEDDEIVDFDEMPTTV